LITDINRMLIICHYNQFDYRMNIYTLTTDGRCCIRTREGLDD